MRTNDHVQRRRPIEVTTADRSLEIQLGVLTVKNLEHTHVDEDELEFKADFRSKPMQVFEIREAFYIPTSYGKNSDSKVCIVCLQWFYVLT